MTSIVNPALLNPAAVVPPVLGGGDVWTVADLDEALMSCAKEAWAGQVLSEVAATLTRLLGERGFSSGAIVPLAVVSDFSKDHAAMHAMLRVPVEDPLGDTPDVRLQANIGVGILGRLGRAAPCAENKLWQRNVRLVASVSIGIGYASASGQPLPGQPLTLSTVELLSEGADVDASTVEQVAQWWRDTCGVAALRRPLRLPTRAGLGFDADGRPTLVDIHAEPKSLAQRLEDLVEQCVGAIAP